MGELNPDSLERALASYVADRVDDERLQALVNEAIRAADDRERVMAMLRRGAAVKVHPCGGGRFDLTLEFDELAEVLAELRAIAWNAPAEQAPTPDSTERDEVLVLVPGFPASALAKLPRG
jgi:hypothetical protein